MKQTVKITFCGIIAALSAVFMLLSYFPYLTYAVPAVAGLLIMITVIEAGYKWALGAYIAASVLVFLFAEPEGKLLYICFFGYYPILKAVFDRRKSRALEWILKLAVFNAAIIAVYFVLARAFGVSVEEFGEFGKYSEYIFLLLGNAVFVLYDIAVSRSAAVYMHMLHPRVQRILRGK